MLDPAAKVSPCPINLSVSLASPMSLPSGSKAHPRRQPEARPATAARTRTRRTLWCFAPFRARGNTEARRPRLLASRQGGGTFITEELHNGYSDPLLEMLSRHGEFHLDLLEFRDAMEGLSATMPPCAPHPRTEPYYLSASRNSRPASPVATRQARPRQTPPSTWPLPKPPIM